jgi:hypothetical protein
MGADRIDLMALHMTSVLHGPGFLSPGRFIVTGLSIVVQEAGTRNAWDDDPFPLIEWKCRRVMQNEPPATCKCICDEGPIQPARRKWFNGLGVGSLTRLALVKSWISGAFVSRWHQRI